MLKMEVPAYPERPGEPDCAYYMQHGLCGYGARCRFNHPPALKKQYADEDGNNRDRQVDCQYYKRTGSCNFGASCKYRHPGAPSPKQDIQLNIYGLPIRLGEKECMYYTHNGVCKFGSRCKFHHPQPGEVGGPTLATAHPPIYSLGAYTSVNCVAYPGVSPTLVMARSAYLPSIKLGAATCYTPVMLPSHNWAVPGPISPSPSLNGVAKSSRALLIPSICEEEFPEREGEPDCQYYLKTGNCRFRAACKFHHPKDGVSIAAPSLPSCSLSVVGLPLRPGEPQCSYYIRYGCCKFGPRCRFDHPICLSVYSPLQSPMEGMKMSPEYTADVSLGAKTVVGNPRHEMGMSTLSTDPAKANLQHDIWLPTISSDELDQQQAQLPPHNEE